MHLSVDAARSAADVLPALVAACRANGLDVARSFEVLRAPPARALFVVEIADPFPEIHAEPSTAAGTSAARNAYPIALFETGPESCRLSTIHPTAFVDLLGHPEAAPAAAALERTLHAVLAAAAGRDARPDDSALPLDGGR